MKRYIGRFAPSPSGPLHMGSLVTALGSWVDAKHHQGQWLLRIEDIDPQRESVEACEQIVESLIAHELQWDGDITYQSARSSFYDNALTTLRRNNQLYACTCTRKQLRQLDIPNYPGICRDAKHDFDDRALRVLIDSKTITYKDIIFGERCESVQDTVGDFIVRRRGPLHAYQLAVVCDDAAQNISHVVRGADLLDNTARQIALQQHLDLTTPEYLHLPVALDAQGRKLSKQTGAPPLDNKSASDNLIAAWRLLGQKPAPAGLKSCNALLSHFTAHWNRALIPRSPTPQARFPN